MSKTQIVWFLIMMFGIGSSFYKGPIFGLITYMFVVFTWLNWGGEIYIAGFGRWSLLVAVLTLISYIWHKGKDTSFYRIPQLKYLCLIIANMIFISINALDRNASIDAIYDFSKLILLYYLIIKIINSKKNYKYFFWFQIWANYLLGWEGYTRGKIVSGRLENVGIPGYESSNHLAVLLIPIIPFIGKFFLYGNKWERIGVLLAAPFIINVFIQANSRGAFLGIIISAIFLILLSTNKIRKKLIIGFVLGTGLLFLLAGEQFVNRMNSIKTYEEDGSATGRIESWDAALKIIRKNPFGQGGDTFQYLSPVYIPDIVEEHRGQKRAVHNTYLMMATDWGVQGLALFLLFFGSTIWELHKIRRRTGSDDDEFYYIESLFIEAGLLGYLVAIAFGNRIYGEVLYWYCALAVALSHIQMNSIIAKKKVSANVR